jgi:hypothetical protein
MIEMLDRYDKRVAAGLLARAALALESGESGLAAKSVVENEPTLRAALIEEARAKLGIKPDDRSPEVIERIGSYFDEESERLLGEPHTTSAFERLIARGDFPSDLYDIRIIPNIKEFFGKDFEREKALIERTIRAPMNEQHFGPPTTNKNQPFLISLFARQFKTPFPFKDFTMLVAGNRGDGHTFHVHQAWRLYTSKVDMTGPADLIELLRRFADVYGYDIDLDGRRGNFFLTAERPAPSKITIQVGGKTRTVTITQFLQTDTASGARRAALVVAIDLDLYRDTLDHMDCKEIA